MREIALSRGLVALVDDEDFEELNRFKWCVYKDKHTFYSHRRARTFENAATTLVSMHRTIAKAPKEQQVDHIDGNGLNNQKSNLRLVDNTKNQHNQKHKRIGCSSKYKGVSWHKRRGMWTAQIRVAKRLTYLGLFGSETEARDAYAAAAERHFGEHAAPYVEATE